MTELERIVSGGREIEFVRDVPLSAAMTEDRVDRSCRAPVDARSRHRDG